MSGSPPVGWEDIAFVAPYGLAVVDAEGRFVRLNPAGVALCGGRDEAELLGAEAPFALGSGTVASQVGLLEDQSDEQVAHWTPVSGARREFAYRVGRLRADPPLTVVSFRDVTDEGHRHRRLAAIARTSIAQTSGGSLGSTLDAVARQILRTDGLAGVQILILDGTGRELRLMASAGLRQWDAFWEHLLEWTGRDGGPPGTAGRGADRPPHAEDGRCDSHRADHRALPRRPCRGAHELR